MSVETVQSYKTPDGKIFLTREDAVTYLYRSEFLEHANEYVASRGMTGVNATRAANVIAEYLAHARATSQPA
jgi:hypothetical protein